MTASAKPSRAVKDHPPPLDEVSSIPAMRGNFLQVEATDFHDSDLWCFPDLAPVHDSRATYRDEAGCTAYSDHLRACAEADYVSEFPQEFSTEFHSSRIRSGESSGAVSRSLCISEPSAFSGMESIPTRPSGDRSGDNTCEHDSECHSSVDFNDWPTTTSTACPPDLPASPAPLECLRFNFLDLDLDFAQLKSEIARLREAVARAYNLLEGSSRSLVCRLDALEAKNSLQPVVNVQTHKDIEALIERVGALEQENVELRMSLEQTMKSGNTIANA